jgi:NADPH:quinone reductase-like Zn-dependent oxidoreductase
MVLGWDAAGVIEEIGADVYNWKVGDHVLSIKQQRLICLLKAIASPERLSLSRRRSLH